MSDFMANAADCNRLLNIEAGYMPLTREKTVRADIDIQTVDNIANEIVEFKKSLHWGIPFTFIQRGTHDSGNENEVDAISELNECYAAENLGKKQNALGRFVEICGITEKEIHDNFDQEVADLAEAYDITKEQCYARLKDMYDGYHFRPGSIGVYNPFSLLNTLSSCQFRDYWFETGTPTILVETLKRTNYELENLTREEVTSDLLGSLDSMATNPLPLMYQSGYLTIKSYDPQFDNYLLGFPNGEVERGFVKFLFYHYAPIRPEQSASFVKGFVTEVWDGRPEAFMKRLETFFADQNYKVAGDAELYFQNAVWIIFKMIGFYTEVERHTSNGRMDMIVKTSDYIYIFEFKLDKTADEALQQIIDKEYTKPFEHDGRHIYKIGVNFSTKTRRIDGWKIAE
jgi:hypothetical protein